MIEPQQINNRKIKTTFDFMGITLVRLMSCCLAGVMLFATGCGQDTRNTFAAALDDCTKGGYTVLKKDRSGDSGYVILGDAKSPHSKVAYALLAVSHDDFYLGSDTNRNVWASVIVFEFTLADRTLSGNGVRFDRGIRPINPINDIFNVWKPKWEDYLRAHDMSLSEGEKTRMEATLQMVPK